ncbi:hypothetical protein [Erythrobacter sp.]|uniref:hypothetical protein n=1 Tax=Erythrobacter sp. TaxID=1042 RepID=UPI001425BCD6|nr:hypothetical protein [Erythrobacter sp.]QIQ87964.1 MAG: hypothetical protein G9473_15625 [Erythrobacter sp.]
MGRWEDMLPAPEFEVALRAVGLPVSSCERQRQPPHHVRARFERKLSLDEKDLAARVKAAVKAGEFDAEKFRPRKPRPKREPIAKELVEIGLIEHKRELKPSPPRPQHLPAPIDDHAEVAGIKALGLEVIRAAWKDAKAGDREAIAFLTAAYGSWAEARAYWCALADLDPTWLQEQAQRHFSKRG